MSARFLKTVPLLVTLLVGPLSCTYLKEAIGLGPIRPKVTVQGIEVKYVTIQALSLLVSIKIENPNEFELSLKNLDYSLVSLEKQVAQGTYLEKIKVPKEGSQVVKLPVAVNPKAAMAVIKRILAQGPDVKATIKASAEFDSPVGPMDVNFEQTKPISELAKM